MPHPPGIIDRVNYVVNFWEDPCDAPWTVYIETALPALGQAAITLVEPSPDDVLRAYVKPGGARSAGRFGGFLEEEEIAGSEPLLKDTSEMIGEAIPFKARWDNPVLAEDFKYFWIFDGVTQRLLWYWMMADLISQFLFDWTTLINKSEYCSIDRGGSALLYRDSIMMYPPGVIQPVAPMEVRKSWGEIIGTYGGTITFSGGDGVLIAGMGVYCTPDVSEIRCYVWDETTDQAAYTWTFTENMPVVTAKQVMTRLTGKSGHGYGLRCLYFGDGDNPVVWLSGCTLNGFGDEALAPPR